MKKKLLLLSLFTASITSIDAQITITSANMPIAGNSYITANDDSITSYGTAGVNQTWDFSSWANTGLDTTSFEAPSNIIGATFFPTATLALSSGTDASFFKNSSTAFELLGIYGNLGTGFAPLTFSPAETFISLPSTYQTTVSGTSSYSLVFASTQPGIDSVKVNSDKHYTSLIDAWGTLTTPAYSNLSTIRQFVTDFNENSTFIITTGDSVWTLIDNSIDTSYTYRWWSNSHSYPVAEIYFNNGDTAFYGNYLTSTLVGVNELAKNINSVSVFPSPASDKVTFKGIDFDSYLMVFDVNGKLVEKTLLRKNTTINVANYNNGVYFYNVAPLNGSAVSKGKFVVEK